MFLQIYHQTSLCQAVKQWHQMLHMVLPRVTIYNDVIIICFAVGHACQYLVHQSLECCNSVLHAKWHNFTGIQSIWYYKGTDFLGPVSQGNLPIALQQIDFGDITCSTNLINAVFQSRKGNRISLRNSIHLPIVNTKSPSSVRTGNQYNWWAPATLTGLNQATVQHVVNFLFDQSQLLRIQTVRMLFNWPWVTNLYVVHSPCGQSWGVWTNGPNLTKKTFKGELQHVLVIVSKWYAT